MFSNISSIIIAKTPHLWKDRQRRCVKNGISTGGVFKSYNNDNDARETPNSDDWKIRILSFAELLEKQM